MAVLPVAKIRLSFVEERTMKQYILRCVMLSIVIPLLSCQMHFSIRNSVLIDTIALADDVSNENNMHERIAMNRKIMIDHGPDFSIIGSTVNDNKLSFFGATGLGDFTKKMPSIILYDFDGNICMKCNSEQKGETFIDAISVKDKVITLRPEDGKSMVEHIENGGVVLQQEVTDSATRLFNANNGYLVSCFSKENIYNMFMFGSGGTQRFQLSICGNIYINKVLIMNDYYIGIGRRGQNGFIFAFDDCGTILWQKVTELPCEIVDAVRMDDDQFVVLACNYNSQEPLFLSQYEKSRNIWTKALLINDMPNGIIVHNTIAMCNDNIWMVSAINRAEESSIFFRVINPNNKLDLMQSITIPDISLTRIDLNINEEKKFCIYTGRFYDEECFNTSYQIPYITYIEEVSCVYF